MTNPFFASPTGTTARRAWLRAAGAATLALALAGCGGPKLPPSGEQPGVAVWNASPQDHLEPAVLPGRPEPAPESFRDQTLRQVVRVSLGGDAFRLQLSNRFNTAPVTFDAVRLARSAGGNAIDASTDHAVRFGGRETITLAPGEEAWSDPVSIELPAHAEVAISSYFAQAAEVRTKHGLARQTAYVAAGNAASAPVVAGSERPSFYWIAGVDTMARGRTPVVVAFGDSITDGFASSVGRHLRYPDQLDNRIKQAGERAVSVVNAGISGNRWLNDRIGPNGAGRFDRDVLGVTGVTHTIVTLGINDIGFSAFHPSQAVGAEEVIAAIDAAVKKAHAAKVKVILGTLLPFKGAAYYSPDGEAKRQAINAWIRANRSAAGVADFDRATRDATDPLLMRAAFDSGDHLHPNDAGYRAMAEAVDLSLLR